jgi:hypothetical protein
MDKRQVYDWDTRIHLLARGPGIGKNALFHLPATQVDLAPTFLALVCIQRTPLIPLQNCLFAPELQRQSRGRRVCLTGRGLRV